MGPGGKTIDGAAEPGRIAGLPPVSFTGTDGLVLHRLSDSRVQEGYSRYLSEDLAVVGDLRAARAYRKTAEEERACARCAPPEPKVREILSGERIAVRFPETLRARLAGIWTYFPDFLLEPRRRAERALVSVVAEAYLNGVSVRKVDRLVRSMGLEGLSKSQVSAIAQSLDEAVEAFRNRPLEGDYPFLWLDAMAIKCREGGRCINVAAVIAIAVNAEGYREVLGVDVVTTEDGAGWLAFLRSLLSRGLTGVQLVVSDAHKGLTDAIASVLPGAAWQRCRTHFMTNLLTQVPKAAQQAVATLVRSIFAQPDADSVRVQHRSVVEHLESRFSKAAERLAEAGEELLAFTTFPKAIWRQIWSNNPLERLNKEVRRRTDVVGIFPNREALLRLVGAVLCEQHDEWAIARRYMSLEVIAASCAALENHQQPDEQRLAIPA